MNIKNKFKINRLNTINFLIILLFIIMFLNLFYIQIVKNEVYKNQYLEKINVTIEGATAPRGRIYDRSMNLIVDNKQIKVIKYKKEFNIKDEEEIDVAYKLAQMLDVNYLKLTDDMKRDFWIKKYPIDADKKITEEEIMNLKYRKLTGIDIVKLKKERITEEELNFSELEKEAAYIYYLMNKGYSYQEKIIKNKDVTEVEYAIISSSNLKGVTVELDWEREYLYGSVFKSILGTVSNSETGIPEDLAEYYKNTDYNLQDRVGISYLELQYDSYLKGEKNKYKKNRDGTLSIIEEGKRGNDIVLTIDIKLQQEVERILEEELLKAKNEPNTTYYNRSFVIINNPKTGEILAMAGKQIVSNNENYIFYDYTPGIFTSSVTAGSVIKGASHIVGYNNGALKIGEKRYDNCVKLKNAKEKCSWKYLGLLDDLTALKHSSNTYQFYTAFKVANTAYYYNMPFKVDSSIFDIYRTTFNEFGLGVKTEIDLPNESIGLKGKIDNSGLILDFAIGQYDNYTPLQIAQYMSTIANDGNRMKFYLLKEVYESKSNLENKIYEAEPVILNKVNTDPIYIARVKEGFKKVLEFGGTGSGYINKIYNPAGKTGTSQSFVDTNSDGIIDTETVSNTFSGYAPSDNPIVNFTVISPDTYDYKTSYESSVNKRITKRISEKYFEIYG